MSVQEIRKSGAQPTSIHYVSVPKICRYFSLLEAKAELRDLITKIVDLYNRTLGREEEIYDDIKDIEKPKWKEQPFQFKLRIYAQTIRPNSRLSQWITKDLKSEGHFETQRVNFVFFLFRARKIGEKRIKEIFALTTGQAYRVVQKFSDYRFPIAVAKRLMNPKILQSQKRPLVGSVILLTEVLKKGTDVSDSDVVDKLFARVKFAFREDSSIFALSCFQNKKGQPLPRGMSAEIGLGLVRIVKEISPQDYPEVLHHLSEIACKQETICTNEKKTIEKNSKDFDFLENFQPADFSLVPRLNKSLVQAIRNYICNDNDLPPFDFCHKQRSDFFKATEFTLQADGKEVEKWDSPPTAKTVMASLKGKVGKKKVSEEDFAKWLKGCNFTYKHEGKTTSGSVLDYLEGELRLKNGEVYWRLHTMWYEIHADYLGLIHIEFRKMLGSCLIEEHILSELWPSPEAKEATKKKLGNKKYDVEAEFNQKFLDKKGFLLGDKICPNGIELGDVFFIDKKEVYFFHVKEGFGHQTRDACSQILNAAKLLHFHNGRMKNQTKVLEQFYDMAIKGGDAYRNRVKEYTSKLSKEEFVEQFSSKKFIFVYAFADTAKGKRLFSKEKTINSAITPANLDEAHRNFKGKGQALHGELFKAGYLSKRGRLTSKFISSAKGTFVFDYLSVKAQREAVYDCLAKLKTQFDSTIAKLELISTQSEIESMGFEFKIFQILRQDYGKEEKTNETEDPDEHFELPELAELNEEEQEFNRDDLREGRSFTVGKEKFDIVSTTGDGACMLHALIGTAGSKSGQYFCPDARIKFRNELEKKKKDPQIEKLWNEWMVNFLKDYLGDNCSIYAEMVFNNVDMDDLMDALGENDKRKEQLKKTKEELFTQAWKDHQERLKGIFGTASAGLKINSKQLLNQFAANFDSVLVELDETPIGTSLYDNQKSVVKLSQARERIYTDFVKKREVRDAYIKGVSKDVYYFSTQELIIAAHLFNKHAVVYTHRHLNNLVDVAEKGGDLDNPKVVIFHKGNHFSHCEPKK
jgi:hypothetical protein